MASPWFPIQADLAQSNTIKNKDERIAFTPNYIPTPIDITYSNENAYLLLPISTDKYTKLAQTQTCLNLENFTYNADYKPNYKQMMDFEFNKTYMTAEDNSIPIYDMNFSFVQTIKFNSTNDVLNWITTNKLHNKISGGYPVSALILFDSENRKFQ